MKRLIKKNEIFDGMNYTKDTYYEVYKNPTDTEIQTVLKQDQYGTIRGLIYDDGTVYCWPGSIEHAKINNYVQNQLDINQFRFAYGNDSWIIDSHNKWDEEELKALINKHIDVLRRFGNINNEFSLFYGKGFTMKEYSYSTQS